MKYISYRIHVSYILSAALLLLVLYSSAFALVVNDTQTWTGTINIDTLAGGILEIGPSGNLTMTGRVNFDGVGSEPRDVCKLIMSGGILNTTNTSNGVKFPDNYGPVEAWINAGTWTAARIQNLGWRSDRQPATIYIGGGILIVQIGYDVNPTVNRDWNPVAWIEDGTMVPQEGYTLKLTPLEAGAVKIEGTPIDPMHPDPAEDERQVPLDKQFSWLAPDGITDPDYDVFFGTNPTAVAGAFRLPGDFDGSRTVDIDDLAYLAAWWLQDPAGSNPYVDIIDATKVNLQDFSHLAGNWQAWAQEEFKGSQAATVFNPGPLTPATWYYWRVDVLDGSSTIPGNLWSFQTTPFTYHQLVTVCADSGKFAGWPANNGVCSWGDEILVSFTQGDYLEKDGHNLGANEVHVQARSLDGGVTWTREDPNTSSSDPASDPPGNINFNHTDFALKSPFNTAGFYYSYDRGATWQGPYHWGSLLSAPELAGMEITTRTDYMVNGEHDCFFFMSARIIDASMRDKSFVARTTDGGATFNFVSWIVPPTDPYRAVMSSTVRCSSTKLVSALRRRTVDDPVDVFWVDVYVSNDNGSTWSFLSKVADTGRWNGNPPALVRLADGRLCCAYGNRTTSTINARFSHDDGATWDEEIILRDDYYPDSYYDPDLGYPRMVQRPDGKLVTMYYWQTQAQYEQQTMAIEATIWDTVKDTPYSGPEITRLAWGSVPQEYTSVARFNELKEAGITHHYQYTYSNADNAEGAMNAAQDAGIKVILTCPELTTTPEVIVSRFKNHPALAAYFIQDEPRNESEFVNAGILADRIRAVDASHFCYLNLLPGGQTNTVGGIPYATYLGWYDTHFNPEIVSFDNYPIRKDKTTQEVFLRPNWYDNLESISAFSKNIGKPFWAFALSVSHDLGQDWYYPEPTLDHLRLQVYSNLAYGAQGIQYFTFWTPNSPEYYIAPIALDGVKTVVYDLVKTVNEEIKNLSFIFYGSTVKWVRHIGIEEQAVIVPLTTELNGTPMNITGQQGGLLVALHEKGLAQYLVIVNYALELNNPLVIETSAPVLRILKSGATTAAENTLSMLPGDVAIYTWNKNWH